MMLPNLRGLFQQGSVSIFTKIGAIFVALSVTYTVFLLITSSMTGHLLGMSSAIGQAGTERMRIYTLASMLQQMPAVPTDSERKLVQMEILQWERVLKGLRFGTEDHASLAAMEPRLAQPLQEVQDRWSLQLRPALEQAIGSSGSEAGHGRREYLQHADAFVTSLDQMIRAFEQEAAGRLRTVHTLQILFLGMSVILMIPAMLLLHRVVRVPLQHLIAGAERLAAGKFDTTISISARDELGQLARTYERMAGTIRHNIEEMNALHATGQEIRTLASGSNGLEQVLRQIVDRAADSLAVDLTIIMVRHVTMECWIVEAASGTELGRIRQQSLLVNETPLFNQAYETKKPVVAADLSAYPNKPMRLRDDFGAQSYLAVPLLGPHACLGVLVSVSTKNKRTFTEWDIQLAQQFASYAAVAMENARLFDTVESESRVLQEKLHAVEKNVRELTHEVKAPAGRVAEFASWIQQDYGHLLDEKGMQYLGWIMKEGMDLAQLAERTLDLARIKYQPTPLESVDVGAVVQEVLALMEKDYLPKGIRISIASSLPRLACRRIHVKQIFENLISNAIKFIGNQPTPMIEIGVEKGDQGTLLFVRDNGAGIETGMAERIFLPFQRVAPETIPGSGIGLSIVRAVVGQYGGAVSVQSTPGVGSTFYVRLPVLDRKSVAPEDGVQERICLGGTQRSAGPS
ncbi:MAG TPA: ATP-binding protein [Nitrospiraceae bacterium]|nr:ATP-binding protein [Nitrospiraceae bacterium]